MSNNIVTTDIFVNDNKIGIMRVGNVDYISLTDLARYADSEEPKYPIQNWMRNKDVISYLGLWEKINNKKFKGIEFDTFKNNAGSNKFKMSPQKWITFTNAIGIISKSGRYNSGTYAHPDIAFEFASWLSPEFKLYLIQEFERLKKNEYYQQNIEWQANRLLSKANYLVHTEAIKNYIIPKVSKEQINKTYADEADIINVALFGMTAKEWRDNNPSLKDKGNIRDYTDMIHLIILSNLENINSSLIHDGLPQSDRLIKLNNIAINQLELFKNNKSIEELKQLKNNLY